jgi:ParB-like chromosome segregation protein Spo0J
MAEFTIRQMSPDELLPHELNPAQHSDRQRAELAKSLGDFGWLSAPIFNLRTKKLVDGHLRVEHARKVGAEKIPVRVIDVDEKTERRILASYDRIGELKENDDARLCALLRGICDDGDPPAGWDAEEVGTLLLALAASGEDEPPAKQKSSRAKPLITCPECGCSFAKD